ncbi:MAG TPA: transglutaminase-like domain-containing protein [Verrucomicrobiae bacterium]|nr:transglutaminase-like domain-containing protein [Verrucomicrobiae bacterium]
MISSAPIASRRSLSAEQSALLTLLADEDSAVYGLVRQKIISGGEAARAWLQPYSLSNDAVLRRHVLEILAYFERQQADTEFLSFCLKSGEDFELETAAWLLARSTFPTINREGYAALLDEFAHEAAERMALETSVEEKLSAFNNYLFSELGFVGNVANYYDPDNSYLNRVLDRRTGNPITLTLLYILVARRSGMPVTGIGLPGHFICRYQSSSDELYIDPFNRGQLLSKADCVKYLQRGNYSLTDDFLAPASPRRMLLRICSNLHQIYTEVGRGGEVTRFQRYLVALAR